MTLLSSALPSPEICAVASALSAGKNPGRKCQFKRVKNTTDILSAGLAMVQNEAALPRLGGLSAALVGVASSSDHIKPKGCYLLSFWFDVPDFVNSTDEMAGQQACGCPNMC
ncbi:hypothetical protein OWV82_012405 [Melia azedarach]|uniref:Uncharacterized protein n=1 Tax=Melia azedarach TaxID=155640 RepID=A0ACC1Y3F8_MELAZ|nr:hypothetical protein OWV82_012405 [Melia azedarach]